MKRSSFLFLLFTYFLLSWASPKLHAQDNQVKLVYHLFQKVAISYERNLNPKTSFEFGGKFYSLRYLSPIVDEYRNKGYRIFTKIKFFSNLKNGSNTGLYFAPNFALGEHRLSYEDNPGSISPFIAFIDLITRDPFAPNPTGSAKISTITLGIQFGYVLRKDQFSFDFGTNLSANDASGMGFITLTDGQQIAYKSDVDGVRLEFFIGLGYVF